VRRALLGDIEIVGLQDAPCLIPLAPDRRLSAAIGELGGRLVPEPRTDWPSAVIGNPDIANPGTPWWRVSRDGWRGGVIPIDRGALAETSAMPLAPALATAVYAAEAFAHHAGDHPMAGRRAFALSLWRPGADRLVADCAEPGPVLPPVETLAHRSR
jgi:hypothetical protein